VLDANPTNNYSSSMAIVPGTAAALALLAVGGLAVFRKHTSQAAERAKEATGDAAATVDALAAAEAAAPAPDPAAAAAVHANAPAPSPAPASADAAAAAAVADAADAADAAAAAAAAVVADAPASASVHDPGKEKADEEEVVADEEEVVAAEALPSVQLDRSDGSTSQILHALGPGVVGPGVVGPGAGAGAGAGAAVADAVPVLPPAAVADAEAANVPLSPAAAAAAKEKAAAAAAKTAAWEAIMLIQGPINDAAWETTNPMLSLQVDDGKESIISMARGDGDCSFWSVLMSMALLQDGGHRGISDYAKTLLGRQDVPHPTTLDGVKLLVNEILVKMRIKAALSMTDPDPSKRGGFSYNGELILDATLEVYQTHVEKWKNLPGTYDTIEAYGHLYALAILYGIGIKVYDYSKNLHREAFVVQASPGEPQAIAYISTNGAHYNVHAQSPGPFGPEILNRIKSSGWVEAEFVDHRVPFGSTEIVNAIRTNRYEIVEANFSLQQQMES